MYEMRVQPARIARPFRSEHGRLPEPAKAVAAEIAAQVFQKEPECRPETRLRQGTHETAQHPQRLFMQIFGQIVNIGTNLVVHRMTLAVGRTAKRDQYEV
ncbi:hypothetical protein D9M72_521800 [compost metagenome]